MEERGLKISRRKTEYLGCNEHQDAEIYLQGETVKRVKTFKYLRSRGRGGHSHIPRHVRAPYYWRQRVISGLETASQGGPQPKHRPPDFDICLYSHK